MRTSAPNTPLGITFHQIDKRYGNLFALRRVSLALRAGEVVACVGASGSGKSTLLRVAALLSRRTVGRGEFPGGPSNLLELRRHIAMVGHATMLYDELTAEENLALFAQLYDLPDRRARIGEALESAGLATRHKSPFRTFSPGMHQRLSIAAALLSVPALLLLDEPTTGLDVQGIAWLASALPELGSSGCTILMSAHVRNESLALATRAVRLEAGNVAAGSRRRADMRAILTARDGRLGRRPAPRMRLPP